MYCGNCGTQFEGKFCPQCGTPAYVEEEYAAELQNGTEAQEYDPRVYEPQGPETEPPVKKKGKLGLILGIVAAVLVLAGAAFLLRSVLSRGGRGNAYMYLGRGKYQMVTNLKKGEAVQFGSSRADMANQQLLAFSADGKYVYFYTKVDESDYTGTLCRAEYGKFKKDASKNDKYIETIASSVRIGFRLLDDGGVVYQNQSGKLYCYDGRESLQIARDVNGYYTDGSDWLVYFKGDYGEMTLYEVLLSDPENAVKLDKDVAYFMYAKDRENVYYMKENRTGDYAQNLYVAGLNRDAERLASDAVVLSIGEDGDICYLREGGGSVSLYDYVDDSKAGDDAGISEPFLDDFEIPNYVLNMIRESNPQESNYEGKELYTSCTQPLYWYGQGSGCSMQDAMNRTWNGNNDAIHETTQSFIDRFGGTADADGFILVTDEVKAALKDINQYGNTASETTWLDMCYVREQNGTTFDYNAYDEAYAVYAAAADRIRLRDELRDPQNDLPLYVIERYSDGSVETLAEDVVLYLSNGDGVLFCTPDQITDRVDITSAYSAYDVRDNLYGKAEYSLLLHDDTTVYTFSSKAWDDLYDIIQDSAVEIYSGEGSAFINDVNGEIYEMETEGATVTDLKSVADDTAQVLGLYDGTLYYLLDEHQRNDHAYGDLYAYRDGESQKLAQDIMSGGTRIYSDSVIEAITDFRVTDRLEMEITLFSGGDKTVLDDEISMILRVDDSHYLYISDGDLYCYDGKEKTKLQSKVDWVWAKDTEEYVELNSSYFGYGGRSGLGYNYGYGYGN